METTELERRREAADLGLALLLLRQARGLDQEELSRVSGICNSSISDYERGRKAPQIVALRRLLGGLGCTLADLEAAYRFIDAVAREQPAPAPTLPELIATFAARGGPGRGEARLPAAHHALRRQAGVTRGHGAPGPP